MRTARRFDPDRPVPDELVAQLIGMASEAPSRFHLRPTRFVVVGNPGNRKRLRRCAYGDARITEAPVVLIVLAYLRPHVTDLDLVADRLLASGAATLDEVARLKATAAKVLGRSGDLAPEAWAVGEAARASMALLVAAGAVGLDSAWIDEFDPDRVRAGFGVPDDHRPCHLIALGHAAEWEPTPGPIAADRIGFAEHFGRPWEIRADEGKA